MSSIKYNLIVKSIMASPLGIAKFNFFWSQICISYPSYLITAYY
jgi:hypothetical protein